MFLFGLHEFLWWRHDVSGEWVLGSIAIWALSPQYELVVLFIIYLRCSSAISFLLLTTQSMAIPWAYEELSLIPLVLAYHSFRWKFMLRPQLSFWIRSKKAGAPWELWMRSVPCFLLVIIMIEEGGSHGPEELWMVIAQHKQLIDMVGIWKTPSNSISLAPYDNANTHTTTITRQKRTKRWKMWKTQWKWKTYKIRIFLNTQIKKKKN